MSHFSVLVITNEEPTDEALTRILLPWHEFECTGIDNEYVQEIDETADKRAEYEADTTTKLKAPDGTLCSPYDDQFYRDPTEDELRAIGPIAGTGGNGKMSWSSRDWNDGRGYRPKIKFIPKGYLETKVAVSELQTFREWIIDYTGREAVPFGEAPDTQGAHKYGYVLLTASGDVYKTIDRTNPNRKWDWWVVGGRFSGKLAAGYDPHTDPENFERCWLCDGLGVQTDGTSENGCNGCEGNGRKLKWPTKWKDRGNSAQIATISLEAIRAAGGARAAAEYDRRHAIIAGRAIPDFDALVAEHGMEAGRNLYWADPVKVDLQKAGEHWLDREDMAVLRGTREAAIETGRQDALTTFAVVKDGEWHERGSMGWFACVSDEKDRNTWRREFNAMLDSLPPTTWLTVVDCHI